MKFNTIGIICEYNPFHFGHLYHINESKKISGCENVVCIMSGSMVQRGDVAVFDKWKRAKMAIDHGSDLVIELPAYYALQSADNFAYGAVSILDKLNVVDGICFGSESDNPEMLKKCAGICANPPKEYTEALTSKLASGAGYPAACEYAMRQVAGEIDDKIFSPNSTLAIAYMKAMHLLDSKMTPFCVKRNNDYHSSASDDAFLSATAIRELMTDGKEYTNFAPDYGNAPTHSLKNAESYILGFLRNTPAEILAETIGAEDGIENLLKNSARKACTLEELFDMCTGKRYTLHRIKRLVMCAILGIKSGWEADYVRILAFSSKGATLIKRIKQESSLVPVTKAADFDGSPMFDADIRATDFASLCCDEISERYCGKDFLNSPYVKTQS